MGQNRKVVCLDLPWAVSVGEPLSTGSLLSFPKVWGILNRILFPITMHVCSKGEMTKLGVTKGRVGGRV